MAKKLIIVAVVLFILALPLIIISNYSMGLMENYAEKNMGNLSAPDWLMKIGSVYRWTFRANHGVVVYNNFMSRYPTHARYPEAKWWLAYCLEQSMQTKEAGRHYEEYADWYPDRPDAAIARQKANNLKYRPY
ncbi:MAG: hypothetical protein WC980_05180 [Candidatus Brocadiia bacterium]